MAVPPNNRNLELLQRRSRKKSYNDRKLNIYKKAEELSILCGTDVAVILFQAADKSSTTQPTAETWPKNPTEVERIIRRYKPKTASTHASSPSTSTPSSSPSRSVPEKRKYINIDLSLSGFSDSGTKVLKADKGKKKLHVQDDNEYINPQEACMDMQFKYSTIWARDELYDHHGALMFGYEDHQAKLASLEAKHKAITERIASLKAAHA